MRYSEQDWLLLKDKRERALKIMKGLLRFHISSYAYGSVARGDVHRDSDIDILIPSNTQILTTDEAVRAFAHVHGRLIVQATPSHSPKGYIFLNPEETEMISFPMAPPMPREEEFYRFGGLIGPKEIEAGKRVRGVNKTLMFVVPLPEGHEETPVKGREGEVASSLDISIETVKERVRVLSRRSRVGRTGVFLKYYLKPDQGFEEAVQALARRNRYFSELLRARGLL